VFHRRHLATELPDLSTALVMWYLGIIQWRWL
jgi:hypothetical protein